MKYSHDGNRRYLILQCRYYKGESNEPQPQKDAPSSFHLFWDYERLWVEWSLNGDPMIKSFENDIKAYNLKSKKGDKTPLTLKALLWSRYLHWNGMGPIDDELKSFECWYSSEYQKWKTNREHRADKRWPDLVKKCLYFKDEKKNPWEHCYAPVLVWRREMWELEKKWCKALSDSYNCNENSTNLISELGLSDILKAINSKNAPTSLLNYVVSTEKENCISRNERFWMSDALKIAEQFIKYAPLGRNHCMYFAYYLGEDDCPFNYDDDAEYKRMGWSQERLQFGNGKVTKLCDFNSQSFQDDHRGQEGIWGWYADPKFPKEQRNLLFFIICNWGRWCPYCDEDKLAEEYLNYHYPGDDKPEYKKRRLILQCRYYNGEDEPLDDDNLPEEYLTFWNFEKCWVNFNLENAPQIESLNCDTEEFNLENIDDDTTPITLKAVMCNRFMHWVDPYTPREERIKGFESWYANSYLQRKKNIERRDNSI